MMNAILMPIALLGSGMSAGVLFGGELGIVPFFMVQTPDRYVEVHSFVAGRYDPFQPICLLTAALADVLIAGLTGDPLARLLCSLAAALAVSVALVSRNRTAPMGRWVKRLDAGALPDGWDSAAFRRRWGFWNRVRTGLAVGAFLVNVFATGALL
jgi:hypothetical protein